MSDTPEPFDAFAALPVDDINDSGARKLSRREVKALVEAQAAAARATVRAKAIKRYIWATFLTISATIGGTIEGVAWGQRQIDAGVAPVTAELAQFKNETEARLSRLEVKVDQGQYRQDVKMDALLLRFGVPNPAPTPVKVDAGR